MHPALWISKTGLDAQTNDIAVISNNLANASTVGFKKSRAVFEDLIYQNIRQAGSESSANTELPTGLMLGTGVKTVATAKSFTQGNAIVTENALDVSIQGRGFFQILLPDGTTAYTRAGDFQLDETGQVVTPGNGYPVQPAITLPQDATSVNIGTDGTVSYTQQGNSAPVIAGNLQTADFVNPAGLTPIGENLFLESGSSGAAVVGTPGLTGLGNLQSGTLESSNVSVVEELIGLIESQRTYEMNAKVVSAVDQSLQFVTQTL